MTGACVECRVVRELWTGDQSFRCYVCGSKLARPGTRTYDVVEFHERAERFAAKLLTTARVRRVASRSPNPDQVERNVEHNMRVWSTELAHDAYRLFRDLQHEFDVDVDGRPLN